MTGDVATPPPSSRPLRRWVACAAGGLALVAAFDAFVVEPRWVEVTHTTLRAPLARPLRVMHLSDLHGTTPATRTEVRSVSLSSARSVSEGSGRFVAGAYELDRSSLYVSRGVGTSLLPVRFFCRPEVAVIDVRPIQISH